MSQFHFTPEHYLELIRSEVPAFDDLQEQVAAATAGPDPVARVLELGTGTGETSRRVLSRHPQARLIGIDVSEEMLAAARRALPHERVDDLLVQGIQDPLPTGPFDLVVSALTVHHLNGPAKAELFRRVAGVLRPGGRFVLGDVVVPEDPADAITPLAPDYDMPSTAIEQLEWLIEAGFEPEVVWRFKDLVVLTGGKPS